MKRVVPGEKANNTFCYYTIREEPGSSAGVNSCICVMIRCYSLAVMERDGLKASLITLGTLWLLYLDNRCLHKISSSATLCLTSDLPEPSLHRDSNRMDLNYSIPQWLWL